jgi:hypothetical protein
MDKVHADNPNPTWYGREDSAQLSELLSETKQSQN